MKKLLLTLFIFGGFLTRASAGNFLDEEDFMFKKQTVLGSNTIYAYLSTYSYNSKFIKTVTPDTNSAKLNYTNSGLRLGARAFFRTGPEHRVSFFTTPYVQVGNSRLVAKNDLTYANCSSYCSAYSRFSTSPIVISPSAAVGIEGGIAFGRRNPVFIATEVLKNFKGYKALGVGLKTSLNLTLGYSTILFMEFGIQHFFEGKWDDLYKNTEILQYKEFPVRLEGLKSVSAFSVFLGINF